MSTDPPSVPQESRPFHWRPKRFRDAVARWGLMMAWVGGPSMSCMAAWQWERVGTIGGPGPRSYAVVAWTGRELLVWGGLPHGINTSWKNDGWRHDPATGTWGAISALNAPSARQFPVGVWTGRELVVWGGHKTGNPPDSLQSGACYDPASDTWRATRLSGAPSKRGDHTMVATGSHVIVWGGYDADNADYLGSGGRYDVAADAWTPLATLNAPVKRSKHSAVWSGSEMIIWGGGYLTDGLDFSHRTGFGCHDPVSNVWRAGPTAGAPAARSDHSAVWTGDRMLIWGGWNGNTFEEHLLQTGAMLDPVTGIWTSMTLTGAPAGRAGHGSAWTGRECIVWGGHANGSSQSGGRYDPSSGEWSAMPTDNAPSGGTRGACAWTGEAFYVLHDGLARAYETGPYCLDGIPDDWQYLHFGAQNPEGGADRDPDGDGQDNRMEYLAGTAPNTGTSRLTLAIAPVAATGGLRFTIHPAVANRHYRLEQSALGDPPAWQEVAAQWEDAGGQQLTVTLPHPGSGRMFFRLAVSLE